MCAGKKKNYFTGWQTQRLKVEVTKITNKKQRNISEYRIIECIKVVEYKLKDKKSVANKTRCKAPVASASSSFINAFRFGKKCQLLFQ